MECQGHWYIETRAAPSNVTAAAEGGHAGGSPAGQARLGVAVSASDDTKANISARLEEEPRLAAAATKLYYNYDFNTGRKFEDQELQELAALYVECKAVLGARHFATQVVRRVDLAQQAPLVMRSGDQRDIAAWKDEIKACEAYIEECMAVD